MLFRSALGDTTRLHSTPGRPQSNPHVEGAHSLFQHAVPELSVEGPTPKDVARRILELAALTWARTLNHKPRLDRAGRSRAQLYQDEPPTEDQVRQARDRLRERYRRQERALETLRCRQDPVVRAKLDQAFEQLGLDDPEGNVRAAIARYSLDHVLSGLATYEAKIKAKTLPPDAGARYLLGIVRNVSNTDEGQFLTEALLRLRLEARDLLLEPLVQARTRVCATTADPGDRLRAMIESAMNVDRQLDRLFWLDAAAETIFESPEAGRSELVRIASRRIHGAFTVPFAERQSALRALVRKVVPLS